jgi:Helix-turn-helix domain
MTSLAHRSHSAPALARQLHVTSLAVGKWRSRFVQERLEGLYHEPRPGAPRTIRFLAR